MFSCQQHVLLQAMKSQLKGLSESLCVSHMENILGDGGFSHCVSGSVMPVKAWSLISVAFSCVHHFMMAKRLPWLQTSTHVPGGRRGKGGTGVFSGNLQATSA